MSAATLILSGCGIYKKYQPTEEVPEGLYGAGLSEGKDTTNFGNLSWREVFTDPYLRDLIDSALVRNTDMRTATLRVEQAEAGLRAARLSCLPSIAFTPEAAVSSVDTKRAVQTYNIPVAASWEIDIFGKLTNAKRKAKAGFEQSQEYEQTGLVAGVANAYYTLLMLDAQHRIAVETEAIWKQSVETTRAMKKAGMVTEAALAQTEATYYGICTQVLDLAEKINQAENSVNLLLARTPQGIARGRLAEQRMPETFSVGVPIQMLANRPDVRAAELSLAQAFYTTNAARAAFYPSITLSGSAGWTNSAGSMIVNPAKFVASAVAQLMQPIFARGANRANLKIAKAEQEVAQLTFEQTLLQAGVEVNEAVEQYQTAKEKADYYEKQVASLETATKSTQLLMKHGNTTYLEVLTAQQTLLTAQLSRVANRFSEIQSMITLYRALGGGRM